MLTGKRRTRQQRPSLAPKKKTNFPGKTFENRGYCFRAQKGAICAWKEPNGNHAIIPLRSYTILNYAYCGHAKTVAQSYRNRTVQSYTTQKKMVLGTNTHYTIGS